MKRQTTLIRDSSPYRLCIDSLAMVYNNSNTDIVHFMIDHRASRNLMLDGYRGYLSEGRIDPMENLPRDERQTLWDWVKDVPDETTEKKIDICRAIYFLMWKNENPEK